MHINKELFEALIGLLKEERSDHWMAGLTDKEIREVLQEVMIRWGYTTES